MAGLFRRVFRDGKRSKDDCMDFDQTTSTVQGGGSNGLNIGASNNTRQSSNRASGRWFNREGKSSRRKSDGGTIVSNNIHSNGGVYTGDQQAHYNKQQHISHRQQQQQQHYQQNDQMPVNPYHTDVAPKSYLGTRSVDNFPSKNAYERSARDFDRMSRNVYGAVEEPESPTATQSDICVDTKRFKKSRADRRLFRGLTADAGSKNADREWHIDLPSRRESIGKEVLNSANMKQSTSEYGSGDPSPTTSHNPTAVQHYHRPINSSRSDYNSLTSSGGSHRMTAPSKSASHHAGFKEPLPPVGSSRYGSSRVSGSKKGRESKRAGSSSGLSAEETTLTSNNNLLLELASGRRGQSPVQPSFGDRPTSYTQATSLSPDVSLMDNYHKLSPRSSDCDKIVLQSVQLELSKEKERRKRAERRVADLERVVAQLSQQSMQKRALEQHLRRATDRIEQLEADNEKKCRQLEHAETSAVDEILKYRNRLAEQKNTHTQTKKAHAKLLKKLEEYEYDKRILERQLQHYIQSVTSGSGAHNGSVTYSNLPTLQQGKRGGNGAIIYGDHPHIHHVNDNSSADSINSSDPRQLESVPNNSPLINGAGEALCSRPPSLLLTTPNVQMSASVAGQKTHLTSVDHHSNNFSSSTHPPMPSSSNSTTPSLIRQSFNLRPTNASNLANNIRPLAMQNPANMHRYQPVTLQRLFDHHHSPMDSGSFGTVTNAFAHQQTAFNNHNNDFNTINGEEPDETKNFSRYRQERDQDENSIEQRRGGTAAGGGLSASSISTIPHCVDDSSLLNDNHQDTRTSTPKNLHERIGDQDQDGGSERQQQQQQQPNTAELMNMFTRLLQHPAGLQQALMEQMRTSSVQVGPSPVSADDDGYASLKNREGSTAMAESTDDGLEWDHQHQQQQQQWNHQHQNQGSLNALSSIVDHCDMWDSKIVWKRKRGHFMGRFASETNLAHIACEYAPRRRCHSESDLGDVAKRPENCFIRSLGSTGREALYELEGVELKEAPSASSLTNDVRTNFNDDFYSLCTKTPPSSSDAPADGCDNKLTNKVVTIDDNAAHEPSTSNGRFRARSRSVEVYHSFSSSFSSDDSEDDGQTTMQAWRRQLKLRKPKTGEKRKAVVRYSPPRRTILHGQVYRRFGECERKAIAQFDFLKEFSTDLSGISSAPASPDRVRLRKERKASRRARVKRLSRSLTDLTKVGGSRGEQKVGGSHKSEQLPERLYENVELLKRRALKRLSSSSSTGSMKGAGSFDDSASSSLPLSDLVNRGGDQSLSSSSSLSFHC